MNAKISEVCTEEALKRVVGIADSVWHEYYSAILSQEQIAYMLEKFQSFEAMVRQIKEENYRYFLLAPTDGASDAVAGYFAVKPCENSLFLSKLYILKEHRGKGIASGALEYIGRMAAELGLSSVWLTVNKGNLNSIGVYKRKGFETVREQIADIGNGFVMDDYIMEKRIGLD